MKKDVIKREGDRFLEKSPGWTKSRMIFVNSMSDLFHEEMPLSFIQEVFRVMNECPQHTFQILTKRADILAQFAPLLDWTPNIWMGVTVECAQLLTRIDDLRTTSTHPGPSPIQGKGD